MESIETNALHHLARSLEQVGVEVENLDLENNELTATMAPADEVHVYGMGEQIAGRWGLALHTVAQFEEDNKRRITMSFTRDGMEFHGRS